MDQEEIWDKIAPEWNRYRLQTPLVVEEFLHGKKGKILDLGCGSGRNFVKIDELEWFGVDFSSEMIELAKDSAYKKKMEVNFKKAEVFETGFNEGFFDYILCYSVLHCLDTIGKRINTLKEIHRVLKVGGEVLISVWGRKSPRLFGKEKECYIPWTLTNEKQVLRYTYLFDKAELEDFAKRIGFEIVKSEEEENILIVLKKI